MGLFDEYQRILEETRASERDWLNGDAPLYSAFASRLSAVPKMAGATLGYPLTKILEQSPWADGMPLVSKYLSGTKEAEGLRWLQENYPTQTKAATDLLSMAEIAPMGRSGGLFNDLALSTHTKVDGGPLKYLEKGESPVGMFEPGTFNFYATPNPAAKVLSLAGESAEGVPGLFTDKLTPSGISMARQTGMPSNRLDEMLNAGKTSDRLGSATAGLLLRDQVNPLVGQKNPKDILSGYEADLFVTRGIDAQDAPTVNAFVGQGDIPQDILQEHMDHVYAVQGIHPSRQTEIVIPSPTGGRLGTVELLGGSSASPPSMRVHSAISGNGVKKGPIRDKYESIIGRPYDHRDLIEFTQVSESLNKKQLALMGQKYKKENNLGGLPAKTKLIEAVLLGRAKERAGMKLNKLEKFAVPYFNDNVPLVRLRDQGHNNLANKDFNALPMDPTGLRMEWGSSYLSGAKAYGGVNSRHTIDLQSGDHYITMSDKHDIGPDIDPIGGHSVVAIAPTQKINLYTFEVDKKAQAGAPKEQIKRAQDKLTDLTGVTRNRGESLSEMNKRALQTLTDDPEMRDYLQALGNMGEFGILTTEFGAYED